MHKSPLHDNTFPTDMNIGAYSIDIKYTVGKAWEVIKNSQNFGRLRVFCLLTLNYFIIIFTISKVQKEK